jgi:amino acid transporter
VVIALYLGWKVYSGDWSLYVPIAQMDLKSGLRPHDPSRDGVRPPRTWKNLPMRVVRSLV